MAEQEKQDSPQLNNQDLTGQDMTGFGLSAKHLWLIIALNALISTAISLLMVLVVGPWAYTGAVSGLFSDTPEMISQYTVGGTPLDTLGPETVDLTPSPVVTSIPEPVVYEVEAGDSLSGIAIKFGISLDDIMTANGLTDPDALQAGQTLLIPIGGVVNATPTFTPIPAPTETEIPFDPPSGSNNKPLEDVSVVPTETPTPIPTATAPPLDEIVVTINNILGYGQLEDEVITILNEGPGVNLSGWKLVSLGQDEYRFPNLFLWNGGSVRIHTTVGANTPSDLYWGQNEAHWFSGDTVTLVDAGGEIVSRYTIP